MNTKNKHWHTSSAWLPDDITRKYTTLLVVYHTPSRLVQKDSVDYLIMTMQEWLLPVVAIYNKNNTWFHQQDT